MRPLFIAPVALVAICSCNEGPRSVVRGEPRHESTSIDRGDAKMSRIELNLGAGELRVSGGSKKLLEADFDFEDPSQRPRVESHSTGFRGDVKISEPSGISLHNGKYRWEVRLTDDVPVDFNAHLGAGEATIDLSSVSKRSVSVNMGVGQLSLDLRGKVESDYSVDINGGVGEARIRLPADAAVTANASGGIGEISVDGLEKRGGRWINPRNDHGPRIHLNVHGGIGQIHIDAN